MSTIIHIETGWLWLAVLVIAVLTVLLVWLVRQNRRLEAVIETATKNTQYSRLNNLKGWRNRSLQSKPSIDAKWAELDQKILKIEARQHWLETHTGTNRSYERAMQMASRGANLDDLIAAGLSRGEAELALHMHGLTGS